MKKSMKKAITTKHHVCVTEKVYRKLIKKQYKIFLKTGKKVTFNTIIDRGIK